MTPQTERCQDILLAASKIVSLIGRADIGVDLIRLATSEPVLALLDSYARDMDAVVGDAR